MEDGYELQLVRMQVLWDAGVFSCNDYAVFSTERLLLTPPESRCPVTTTPTNATNSLTGNLALPGQTTRSWLNTANFIAVWTDIARRGLFRDHDFTVKVDPDSAFFPERLRRLLREPVPLSLGGAYYVLNCDRGRTAMFGSVEVFSRRAVEAFADGGGDLCSKELPWTGWGEDYFMQKCMDYLHIGNVLRTGMLSDYNGHCTQAPPTSCALGDSAAFHPFKATDSFLACLQDAAKRDAWKLDQLTREFLV